MIGGSVLTAKPGHWVTYVDGDIRPGRVLGRIDETDGPNDCVGWLAVIRLYSGMDHAGIDWVDPQSVRRVEEKPPRALLEWLTGDDWVRSAADIARILAMGQYGTLSEQFISTRDDPAKPYNARKEYRNQWILQPGVR